MKVAYHKYQIHSNITFSMDDSKWSIHMKTFLAYFSINGRFCLVSLKNPTFSNIFPRAKHVLMTFEFWTLCACLSIFSLYISHLLLSSQHHPSICELFHIQVLMMVIKTETLTSTLHHDIFTYLDYIFSCYLHIYIYKIVFSMRIRSGLKAFTTIKDVLKQRM